MPRSFAVHRPSLRSISGKSFGPDDHKREHAEEQDFLEAEARQHGRSTPRASATARGLRWWSFARAGLWSGTWRGGSSGGRRGRLGFAQTLAEALDALAQVFHQARTAGPGG